MGRLVDSIGRYKYTFYYDEDSYDAGEYIIHANNAKEARLRIIQSYRHLTPSRLVIINKTRRARNTKWRQKKF